MNENRCQAKHPKETWPYVRSCTQLAAAFKVPVEPLGESLDLCREDYFDYLSSLPLDEARKLQEQVKYPRD